jgi:hypothetical protein
LIDGCDAEEWSLLFLPDILKELGYAEHRPVSWYWCLPEYTVAECLLPLTCDADAVRMINESAHHKNLRIYIDHSNFIAKQRQQMDDVNVYGTSGHPLPLISPKNVVSIDNNEEDNLTKIYDDVPKSSINNADCNGFDFDGNASGSEIDGNFVDSDNEFGQDDGKERT